MTTAAPVAFEIEIKTSPVKTADPAIKKRLSIDKTSAPPTREDIDLKLRRAEEARKNDMARRGRTDEKVIEARWRKSSMEDE